MAWSTEWAYSLDMNRFEPYPLQFANIHRIENNDVVYIFDETGSGKTIVSGLMTLHYLYSNPNKKVLILTIPTLVSGNQFLNDWYEILPFQKLGFYKNIEICNDIESNIAKLAGGEYGLIILDEAHRYLEAKKRRQELHDLHAEKVVLMTATPVKRGAYNIQEYCNLAEVLCSHKVDRSWLGNMVGGKDGTISETFNPTYPVTRYFKDTIAALEYIDNGTIDFEKVKAVRKFPEIWWFVKGKREDELLNHIEAMPRQDTDGNSNRYIIFTRLIQAEQNIIERHLQQREHFVSFDAAKDDEERLTFVLIHGNSKHQVSEFSHNGTQKRLPDILVINYQIAEAGVNLPGYNYVINYHVSAFPSSLEQRFGRIDRMGKRNGTKYSNIHMVYYLPRHGGRNLLNFTDAIFVFRHDLLTYIPAKNSMLSKEVLAVAQDDVELMKARYRDLGKLCEEQGNLELALEELKSSEPNGELAHFCVDQEFYIDGFQNTEDLRTAILDKLDQLKKDLGNIRKLNEQEMKNLFDKIQDSIYYYAPDAESETDLKCLHTLDAIKNDNHTGCAEKIYAMSVFREYRNYFDRVIRIPLRFTALQNKYADKIEEFFEKEFLATKHGWNCKGDSMDVPTGNFDKLFVTDDSKSDYAQLLRQDLFAGAEDQERDDIEFFLKYCTKAWIDQLPFFKMSQKLGNILEDSRWTYTGIYGDYDYYLKNKFEDDVLCEAYKKLKPYIPEGLSKIAPCFETFIVQGEKKNFYECSNWLKLAYISHKNCYSDEREFQEAFHHFFYSENGNLRAWCKYCATVNWSGILPYYAKGRGCLQAGFSIESVEEQWSCEILELLLEQH